MKAFMDKDFLLESETAKKLYHEVSKILLTGDRCPKEIHLGVILQCKKAD